MLYFEIILSDCKILIPMPLFLTRGSDWQVRNNRGRGERGWRRGRFDDSQA